MNQKMTSAEVRKAMREIDQERAGVMAKMKRIDLWLSGYDNLVVREQRKIRDMKLPQPVSVSKWMERKTELESERAKYLVEKANLELDLGRLKLHKQELADIEHTTYLLEQEKNMVCPVCGANLWMETSYVVRCNNGHVFTLVREE